MMSDNLDFVLSHKQSILLFHTMTFIINKAFLATDLTTYIIPQLGPVASMTLKVFSSLNDQESTDSSKIWRSTCS